MGYGDKVSYQGFGEKLRSWKKFSRVGTKESEMCFVKEDLCRKERCTFFFLSFSFFLKMSNF